MLLFTHQVLIQNKSDTIKLVVFGCNEIDFAVCFAVGVNNAQVSQVSSQLVN
jgi:hypothetical protein